jgi:hypothetical protein
MTGPRRSTVVPVRSRGGSFQTLESLEADVRMTVLPDDAETPARTTPGNGTPKLLRAQGIETSPEELRVLPYDVEFSDRLRARVSAGA